MNERVRSFVSALPRLARTGDNAGQVQGNRGKELRLGQIPALRFMCNINMEPATEPDMLTHASRGLEIHFPRWELAMRKRLVCQHEMPDGKKCEAPLLHAKSKGHFTHSQQDGQAKTLWRRGGRPVVQVQWDYGKCANGHTNRSLDSLVLDSLPARLRKLAHTNPGLFPL